MTFNETLVYLFTFILFMNLTGYLKNRWKLLKADNEREGRWEFKNRFFLLFLLFFFTFSYVVGSCYYAYLGFRTEYSNNLSIIATAMFMFGGFFIFRSAYYSAKELI